MSEWERDPTTGVEKCISGYPTDSQNQTVTFTSSDTTDGNATLWTSVATLTSGEHHESIFAKISQMFKNVRYLFKELTTVKSSLTSHVNGDYGGISLAASATNVALFNMAHMSRVGNLILCSFDIRFSTVYSSSTVISDALFAAEISGNHVRAQTTAENANAKSLIAYIDKNDHKIHVMGGDAGVVYYVTFVYVTNHYDINA